MDGSEFVFWTVRARRALIASLTMMQSREEPSVQARLERMLQSTFRGHPLVVHDRLTGFTPSKEQHILYVEVGEGPETRALDTLARPSLAGSYVVKIGPRSRLDRELAGWRECRPVGLNHDIVLLPQWQGHSEAGAEERGADDPWTCVVYGDAHQLISVEQTLRFEDAVLDAVRHGLPTLDSICGVLVQLYERVGHLLYRGAHLPGGRASHEDRPCGGAGYLDDIPRRDDRVNGRSKLSESIDQWNHARMLTSVRTEVGLFLPTQTERYVDPVSYIERVRAASELHAPSAGAGQVPLDAPVPGMLRGPAHGDLHGRNVLVGLVRDRVLFPALFDYEEMGRDNFIGWDFVKMEYELKMRAYAAILPRKEPVFVTNVHQHELMLAELTEDHHRDGSWDETLCRTAQTPLERLAAVITQIRHLASAHLGASRSQRWLDEYYFLSALYGVHAGRFPNLQRRELAAALISAGVAASRTAWARQQHDRERKLLGV